MSNITFLHVSDLHFQAGTEFDRKIVIDALLKDIRKLRAEGYSFDAVLFTGDLVMAGSANENFTQVVPKFDARRRAFHPSEKTDRRWRPGMVATPTSVRALTVRERMLVQRFKVNPACIYFASLICF